MNIEHNMHDILGQTKTAGQSIRKRYAAFFLCCLCEWSFLRLCSFISVFFVLSFSLLLINWASSIPLSSHLSHCPMIFDHSMIWSSMNIDNKANQKIENEKKKKIIGIFSFFLTHSPWSSILGNLYLWYASFDLNLMRSNNRWKCY